ncbi:hypothetical protein ACFW9O_30880 [Streptomyces sp. NPDC059499]|uniref:hypothetical protein n=1 Tax=Streptomyces sp. NPDC059499 TaxID=3346852 RepID=UPI0036AE7D0C
MDAAALTRAGFASLAAWRASSGEVDALHAQKDHARYLVEQRDAHYLVKVVTVDGLLFPMPVRSCTHRKRRRIGARKWQAETVYGVTDLAADQTDVAEIAAWARAHTQPETALVLRGTVDQTYSRGALGSYPPNMTSGEVHLLKRTG